MNSNIKTIKLGLSKAFNPKTIVRELITLNKNDYIILGIMLFATVGSFLFSNSFTLLSFINLVVSVTTALSLILVDRGRLTNYFWGLIGSAFWLVTALQNQLFGDVASQFYYVVMQFIGIFVWFKNTSSENKEEVSSQKIPLLKGLAIFALVVVLYLLVLFQSHKLQGNQIFLDSALLPLGIVSQILMTKGYRSQWLGWIAINVINVIVWFGQVQSSGMENISMLVLQIVMLINSIYGLIIWYKKSKENEVI